MSLQPSAVGRKIKLSIFQRPAQHAGVISPRFLRMLSFRSQTQGSRPAIAEAPFREVMRRPAIAREFFLPIDHAWWDGGSYTLGRWAAQAPRPHNTGVRLQEPRTSNSGLLPEKDTQRDLSKLIESVVQLRKVPDLSGVVLSNETLVGDQVGATPGKRVQFGLNCPPDGRFKNEEAAARECYRVVCQALGRTGYLVEHPKAPPVFSGGLTELTAWARTVRLRRKPKRKWVSRRMFWLIFLLLNILPLMCLPKLLSPGSLMPGMPGAKELEDLKKLQDMANPEDILKNAPKDAGKKPPANPPGNPPGSKSGGPPPGGGGAGGGGAPGGPGGGGGAPPPGGGGAGGSPGGGAQGKNAGNPNPPGKRGNREEEGPKSTLPPRRR
jgi:hypothetical protein